MHIARVRAVFYLDTDRASYLVRALRSVLVFVCSASTTALKLSTARRSWSISVAVRALSVRTLTSPGSMTYRTPGRVSEVSAMLVASTTLVRLLGLGLGVGLAIGLGLDFGWGLGS